MHSRSVTLVALSLLGLGAATTASAQTVINAVPYAISASGKYVLGDNLLTASGSQTAITISAPNVILDLNGFFVSGPGGNGGTIQAVIEVQNVSNVTIRNETVANNTIGIRFIGGANASNYLVENVNVTRREAGGVIFSGAAPGSRVRNNSFSNISGRALDPVGIRSAGGVSVEKNLISVVSSLDSLSYGIDASGRDFVAGNKISSCSVGVRMTVGGKFLNNLTSNCPTPFMGGTNATGNN